MWGGGGGCGGAGGWLLGPIAGVSFGIWAVGLRARRFLGEGIAGARELERCLDGWLGGRVSREVMVREGLGSGVLTACEWVDVFEGSRSGSEARRRFEGVAGSRWAKARREMVVLKGLTAAAPLLGLLGTVTGMVGMFMAVSDRGSEGAELVAEGIRTALITTQFGLAGALPGVFGLLHLSRLRERLQSAHRAIGMMVYVARERDREAA